MRFHGTSTSLRAFAGLAFIAALVLNVLTISRTFHGLVHDQLLSCLLYCGLAVGLSLTLPVFWTLARR